MRIAMGGWLGVLCCACCAQVAALAPGEPDTDFGLGDGRVVLSVRNNPLDTVSARALLRLPDGRYLAGGSLRNAADNIESGLIERRLANGVLDLGWGAGGVRLSNGMSGVRALARRADGGIIAAGTFGPAGAQDATLERYAGNGTLDAGFGNAGNVLLADLGNDVVHAVGIDSQGRTVYAGVAGNQARIGRLAANGQPDPAFNGGQERLLSLPSSALAAYALLLEADDRIVVAGSSMRSLEERIFAARLLTNGTPDGGFGSGGIVEYDLVPGPESVRGLARRADGRYWLGGSVHSASENALDFLLVRLTATGALDPTAGMSAGWVRAGFPAGGADAGTSLVLGPSGAPMLVGSVDVDVLQTRVGAVRFQDADGEIDTGFGLNGRVLLDVHQRTLQAHAAAIEPDGRLVLAGTMQIAELGSTQGMLARLQPDGAPDPGFRGMTGYAYQPLASGQRSNARLVRRQTDGKLLVAAVAEVAGEPFLRTFVARYTAAGALDLSYGGGDGSVELPLPPVPGSNPLAAIALQPDGKLLVAMSIDETDLVVHRLTSAGALDPGYGVGGTARIDLGGTDALYDLAIDGAGRALLAGFTQPTLRSFVARLTTGGVLDAGFAAGGATPGVRFEPLPGLGQPRQLALQADGRILVSNAQVLVRLSADGVFEPGFGNEGGASFGTSAAINDILPLADGRILLAGLQSPGGNDNWRVMRLLANGQPDPGFANGGAFDYDSGSSRDSLNAIAVQRNGRIVLAGELARQAALGRLEPNGDFDLNFSGSGRVLTRMGFGLTDLALSGDRIVAAGWPHVDALLTSSTLVQVGADVALTVQVQGSAGSVASTNGSIQCGSTCVNDFAPGESVTLAAQPGAGSAFLGWTGVCAGAGTLCQFIMPATPLAIGALFGNQVLFRNGFE
ncbi:MAG: hypothetical protein JNL89_08120 [Rhodanobacteraceae bacterium]|nr:hypothetical protein [Rhodanobacteraceae bacterium]